MVTQSNIDYDKWKKEVGDYYLDKYPQHTKYVNHFIKYVGKTFDSHRKSYFPYQLMWYLYEKKGNVIMNNQHYWIAFIGRRGGEGKSTLARNILYFLDNTFNNKRIASNYNEFIYSINPAKKQSKFPSVLLDEPEVKTHVLSKKGRELRDILGKVRQLNLFVGICANSLSDVPSFIYDRLTAIVYITPEHRLWLWDASKDKKGTVINEIKKGFSVMQHQIFRNSLILKRACFKNLTFSKESTVPEEEYLKSKEQDLMNDINGFVTKHKVKKEDDDIKYNNEYLVKMLSKNNPDLTDAQLGKALGLSREWTNILRNRDVKRDSGTKTSKNMGQGAKK